MKHTYKLLLIVLLVSCSKSDTSAPTPTTPTNPTNPTTPTNPTAPTATVWQLRGISIDNTPQTLTSMQASFKMMFHNDGRYTDTDGVIGNWMIPSSDSLRIDQINLPTPISLKYKIKLKTATTMSLTHGSADKIIDLTYEAK